MEMRYKTGKFDQAMSQLTDTDDIKKKEVFITTSDGEKIDLSKLTDLKLINKVVQENID